MVSLCDTIVNFEQMTDLYVVTPQLSFCNFNIYGQVVLYWNILLIDLFTQLKWLYQYFDKLFSLHRSYICCFFDSINCIYFYSMSSH